MVGFQHESHSGISLYYCFEKTPGLGVWAAEYFISHTHTSNLPTLAVFVG